MIALVIYKKKDRFVARFLKDYFFHTVGDVTGNGWRIVSVQIFYDGKFIEYSTYSKKHSGYFTPKKRRNKFLRMIDVLFDK